MPNHSTQGHMCCAYGGYREYTHNDLTPRDADDAIWH